MRLRLEMPNDCDNHVMLYADKATIQAIADSAGRLFDLVKATELPEGTRVYNFRLHAAGQGAIRFSIDSAWAPPDDLFAALVDEYPIVFMKNEWYVEDGPAGVWVATKEEGAEQPVIQTLGWDEGCIEEKVHRFREVKEREEKN